MDVIRSWHAECPTCHARPDSPCVSVHRTPAERRSRPNVHEARIAAEFGTWRGKYDRMYRDSTLAFELRPYGRKIA